MVQFRKQFSNHFIWLSLVPVVLLIGWLWAGSADVYQLGYCPTMESYARTIEQAGRIDLVEFASSGQALESLQAGLIDVALIGRRAYPDEVASEARERLWQEGYTLIGFSPRLVDSNELAELAIHTYLDERIVSEILPGHQKVAYYQAGESIQAGWDEAALIPWRDHRGEPLIVPIDAQGEKEALFRSPFFYYHREAFDQFLNDLES